MQEIYGAKWISCYGPFPSETWIKALGKIDGKRIAQGLTVCLERGDPWPPSLPEFIELCKEESVPACHQQYIPTQLEYFNWWERQIMLEAGRVWREIGLMGDFQEVEKRVMEESLR